MKEYDLSQPMDKLIDVAVRKFGEVEFQTVSLGDVDVATLQIKNMQQYLDKLMDKTRSGKTISLPLWAKVWPSSLVMGLSLARYPFPENATILEVGGGAAVNGIALAKRGHDVTIVDADQDALLFSRINVLKNGLDGKVKVEATDFSTDSTVGIYDFIVACEMLFEDTTFDRMGGFMDASLGAGETSEAFLSVDMKKAAGKFFMDAGEVFNIMKSSATFKEEGEEKRVNLFRMKRKNA